MKPVPSGIREICTKYSFMWLLSGLCFSSVCCGNYSADKTSCSALCISWTKGSVSLDVLKMLGKGNIRTSLTYNN